jgi:hypothetical protein
MRKFLLLVVVLVLVAPAAWAGEKAPEATPGKTRGPGVLESLRKDVDGLAKYLNLEFYGHIKLDSSRDSAETNFGNTAFFVKNYGDGDKDEEINMTARHTRLGLNWKGPEYEGIKAFAKIEIDFLGKAVQKNTETMELQGAARLRHAYMKFDFGEGWSLTAGQVWDVFAPLNMKKVNTMVGWGQGNLGYRRPMAIIAKEFGTGEKCTTTVKFAFARPVARDSSSLDGDAQDDGEDSGKPDLQAHIGVKMPGVCEKPIKVGLGGFYGWREVAGGSSKIADEEHYESHGLCLDLVFPILDNLDLLAEFWMGKALDGYRGGVWQSYVVHDGCVETINARGGFLNLVFKPVKKWRVSAGYGIDDPDDDDFNDINGRYKNTSIFANVMWSFYKGASVALEYEIMETEYMDDDCTNNRIQLSFMLKF